MLITIHRTITAAAIPPDKNFVSGSVAIATVTSAMLIMMTAITLRTTHPICGSPY
jgi:hypothetical protein